MKLKKILKESEKEEVLERIEELLQKDYWNNSQLLYRGTNNEVDIYDIRSIRKNRKPRDTKKPTHCIVGAMEDEFYSEYPKRSKSKFATPDAPSASGYGVHRVVVFPEKNADVYSSPFDPTTSFFHDSYNHFESLMESLTLDQAIKNLREDGYKELSIWLQKSLKYYTDDSSYSEYCSYTKKNIREIYKQTRDLGGNYEGSSSIRGVFDFVEDYFRSLDDNIGDRDMEVIFNGEKYLAINEDLFKDNFSWAGRWMRK